MSLDGRAIANFVLDICESKGRKITNLSLQKIVYFCHVWSLVELRKPLVKQQFEAWKFGPVLQYLYRDFRDFERDPIVGRAMKLDPITGNKRIVEYVFDAQTEQLLRRVVDFYSQLNSSDLVKLSHAKGGPWDQVWSHQGNVNPGMKIDNDLIVGYYSKMNESFSLQ